MNRSPVVLVTGSTSGIGEGIARDLVAHGYRVALNSRISTEAGTALAEDLEGTALPVDIAHVVRALIESDYVTGEVIVVDGGLNLR